MSTWHQKPIVIFSFEKAGNFPGVFAKRIYLEWICGNDYSSNNLFKVFSCILKHK